jgi:hypothetical protein
VADFKQLGISGASLLVQGENLPKGSLSQIVLYPQAAVEGFVRARTLLAKVLQILRNFGMDQNERELGYLTANAAQFSNLNLSALPTHAGDDSLARAVQLFAQFMALAAYADLREGPAGGTDGLVDVFENAGKMLIELAVSQDTNLNSAAPWRRLANLTRRNPRVVRDAARALGMLQEQLNGVDREVTAIGDFGNNKGIRRIWRLLQLVQVLGIPVSSLAECALITCVSPPAGTAMPGVIAANIKNAVKARYTPEVWRPIAKSVFDKLRQKKRDALVDWLVDHLKLENSVQLFEYFLVDPGMEPVVQTSRLRLAMSSVQTFIQRCLLNLENGNTGSPETNVSPSAIKADWWEWMKRYRVWQANREIFLFAENWMEPEMRMDKSDLFQALESTLLQGDVTTDLVEDAFLAYLKGLEVRARLDVVAMYLDQDATRPGLSTLHVIGRTYGVPHKYFYRTYANESWSAWEAVTPDIEGDHITLVVWRGRVNLFWVTFMPTGQPPSSPAQDPADTTAAASLPFSQLASRMFSARAKPQVKVQLHWAEYFQGKWSDRISTDMARYDAINVSGRFNANKDVYIHVSKEMNAGEEGAVRIHLDFTLIDDSGALVVGAPNYAFRVTSKNCQPDLGTQYWETSATNPYNAKAIDATLLTGSGLLQASFNTHIASDGTVTPTQESILHAVNNFALLRCANPVVPTPFLDPGEPRYQEAGALVSPFFFKDTSHAGIVNELTFFVQPSLTETTIREREGWAISPIFPDRKLDYVKIEVPVLAQVPHFGPIDPGDLVFSLYQSQPREDWVINPRTAIAFRNTWIHQEGAAKTPGGPPAAAVPSFLDSMGFTFVGSQGLNLGQLQNITSSLGGIFGNIAAIEKQNR